MREGIVWSLEVFGSQEKSVENCIDFEEGKVIFFMGEPSLSKQVAEREKCQILEMI